MEKSFGHTLLLLNDLNDGTFQKLIYLITRKNKQLI